MTWQAPTPGQATLVGHVNQLLMSHASSFTYNGAVIGTDPTLTSAATALGTTMLAHTFTIAAPVNLGRVDLALGAIGAGQDVLVTLQADSGGYPSGIPLVGCVIPPEWLPAGVAAGPSLYTVPLPQSLAAGTYHVVLEPGSTLSGEFSQALAGIDDVQWTQSTLTSGAQIYTGGAWVSQTYGFGVYLRDNTGSVLRAIADDTVANLSYPVPAKVASYAYSNGVMTNAFLWVIRSLNVTPNLLCRDDASFESSLGSAINVVGSSLSRSTTALDGEYSLAMTNTVAGTMTAQVGPYPVTAGDVFSWVASFLGAANTVLTSVAWYDGATLLSTSNGTNETASPTSWVASSGTATAPATATQAYVQFTVDSAALSSVYNVDGVGLFPGPASVWSYPGIGIATARSISYTNGELTKVT